MVAHTSIQQTEAGGSLQLVVLLTSDTDLADQEISINFPFPKCKEKKKIPKDEPNEGKERHQ